MRASDARREATPARARTFWRRTPPASRSPCRKEVAAGPPDWLRAGLAKLCVGPRSPPRPPPEPEPPAPLARRAPRSGAAFRRAGLFIVIHIRLGLIAC